MSNKDYLELSSHLSTLSHMAELLASQIALAQTRLEAAAGQTASNGDHNEDT